MKIKIRPYPNFQITERAFNEDVVSTSVNKSDSSGLSNHLIMITEFKTGEKRVIKVRPVNYDNKLFLTAFPNPIHLFLSLAIEHYDFSEQIKSTNFPKCGKQYGDNIYILDIEENGTHDCYNRYIKYRVSSIIMLVSSMEAYLNHIIPNDFIYKTIRKGRDVTFDKVQIESSKVSFREKLLEILPTISSNVFDWTTLEKEKNDILDLYENRKNLIHLKTNAADDFERYFDTIDKMLDFDIPSAINSTIFIINTAFNDFIELEK
jgi:hypothetical protein